MAKWDGKQDLNNNDDEGPMPNNRANGLRTAIKTHGTLFVHQRKGNRSISLLVMFGLLIKVFIERQFCFTFARSMQWYFNIYWYKTQLY
jgi:hypothetical protein